MNESVTQSTYIHISNDNGSYCLRRCFLSSITAKTSTGLVCICE